jgi:prepilin-type processing-associated H-X9-DG protein
MIVAAVLLPVLRRPQRCSLRISCVDNLKQIGLAYRIWEGDSRDIYPTGISVTNGGSMEMVVTGNVLQTFLVMSNELCTPEMLYCPEDSARVCANGFFGLANSNVCYFVSADVTNDENPQLILSGDSNFEIGGKPVPAGLLSLWTNDPVAWSATRHVHSGNIALADGSVQHVTTSGLQRSLVETGIATNRLAIP